ncbi:MAG: AAA family ATPase [Bacteroidales bacterium]
MKIVAIRGKNLASLEGEFEIDFTKEPLKSAGIFAITGSTGAGKSTILDALCLALFDQTPRTNVGENVFIQDVQDKTINQKDSRTILRRGTSQGYAEVDFYALSGNKYRAKWSVRRANAKIDGSMQNAEIRLLNVDTGLEVPGRKTEILSKIVELIGLNFDQFTRAVLLAQGDFATFLKAKTNEKAELLEKLTGTNMYSRISISIYEKTKKAEQDLNHLKERVQDIELLSPEEWSQLEVEKQNLLLELAHLKEAHQRESAKIKWLNEDTILNASIVQAEEQLRQCQASILQAKPRYTMLSNIDCVQEIRDVFMEFQNINKQIAENKNQLYKQKIANESSVERLTKGQSIYISCEKLLQEVNEKYKNVEIKIQEARALDIRIVGAKANMEDAFIEFESAKHLKEKNEISIQAKENEIAQIKTQIALLSNWFDTHKQYNEIIPKADLILALLEDATNVQEQLHQNVKILTQNQQVFQDEHNELCLKQEEFTHLNSLLPSEIVMLRTQLQEGVPCPVCGSIHHSVLTPTEATLLREEELKQAKIRVETSLNSLNEQTEKRKNEITRLLAVIENYEKQKTDTLNKVQFYLANVASWQDDFAQGILRDKLKNIVEQGAINTVQLTKESEQLSRLQTSYLLEKNMHNDHIQIYIAKQEKYNRFKLDLEKLQSDRMFLFQGKSVEEVIALYTQKIDHLTTELKMLNEEKEQMSAQLEASKGILKQIEHESLRLYTEEQRLKQNLDSWIATQNLVLPIPLTFSDLSNLLAKDTAWLNAEKQFLQTLNNAQTTAMATLSERHKNLSAHQNADIKPDMSIESLSSLQEEEANIQRKIEAQNKRAVQIELSLSKHQQGKEKIKSFSKDLSSLSIQSENWKKLNELLGSATGSKFKEIAQGYTLDILLSYANKHLQEFEKRYELQRIPDTLALQVSDLDMLGEIRTVHSLSGGESFLISLALALGLSSLSSNRMKVESLFIDEGFGSLDSDTLRVAMDALESLQNQGRKIGVISHLTEMTERIATQIRVIKTVNGKSKIDVVG